ncbi:SDR family NAD(P)-dependent oxidoreductase [bacterium]|nr:MAG: SDR family NAD(P)-dependent oxidoreductase [bacterium]
MQITGNTILITGGNSGIGRAMAEALHKAGNQVIIAGRNQKSLDETVAANPGMNAVKFDVSAGEGIRAFAQQVISDYPAVNVLINNAGIMKAENLLAQPEDLADMEATISTNLLAPIRLIAAFLPHLQSKEAATIINVTSGLASVPLAATATYNATKAAMHSYSQSLRFQLKDTTVQVIEWAPPAVATELMPGHSANPQSMPLDEFIAESMDLLKNTPDAEEILVERVKFLRFAERSGQFDKVFNILNTTHP